MRTELFVAGEWRKAASGRRLEVVNPATEETLATVEAAGEADVGAAVDAARACFEMAGIGPDDVDLAQLQDGEVGAEIMHMAENGLCKDGEQEALIQAGETEIGGGRVQGLAPPEEGALADVEGDGARRDDAGRARPRPVHGRWGGGRRG